MGALGPIGYPGPKGVKVSKVANSQLGTPPMAAQEKGGDLC